MTGILLALMVGALFGTGVYMILRRDAIKLLLGLGLLGNGINLLLFGSGTLKRGAPPIIVDAATFAGDISAIVDPLPQSLVLTAIVINFGVTAFIVVLVNRRNLLAEQRQLRSPKGLPTIAAPDVWNAFTVGHVLSEQEDDPDDYEWIVYSASGGVRLRDSDPISTSNGQGTA